MPVVDFSQVPKCNWCGLEQHHGIVFRCPSCHKHTCRECMWLIDDAMHCKHMTPRERAVVTTQDWNDAT